MNHIIPPEPPSPTAEQIAALLRNIGWGFAAYAVKTNAITAAEAVLTKRRLLDQIAALERRIAELSPPPGDPDYGVRFTGD